MGLCKDCRWWESGTSGYIGDESWTWGDCRLAVSGTNYQSKATAFATDNDTEGEWIEAVLVTHRDFGCVQFEAKD